MNYDSDNKIWRVGGPLLTFFGIRFMVESMFFIWIWYEQFKEFNLTAAFNGITYIEQLGDTINKYSLAMSGVSMLITIPIMYILMKKDFEYPVNRRRQEKIFNRKKYLKEINMQEIFFPALVGVTATLGISRLITMLPIDGILGDYSQIQLNNSRSSFLMQLLILGVLAPVVEELLFRGLIFKRLKIYYEVTICAYISSIIFAVAHFNLIQGLYAFVIGIILCFVYEKHKNIIVPIIMHMAANIIAVIVSVNPISKFIDERWYLRIPVGLVFSVAFGIFVMKIYSTKKEDE